MKQKIILSMDTGIDDALGLLLAVCSPEVEVIGVLATAGNTNLMQVASNARFVLDIADKKNIPVYLGAEKPLLKKLTTATFFSGSDGLAGLNKNFLDPRCPSIDAVSFLLQSIEKYGEELTIVSTGPLTNLALAVGLRPKILSRIKKLIVMGGAITVQGNVTPAAEANIYNDPHAAKMVFDNTDNIILVGLDVTNKVLVTKEHLLLWKNNSSNTQSTPIAKLAIDLLSYYIDPSSDEHAGAAMHDPLAVAVAIKPDLITTKKLNVMIETVGNISIGQTIGNLTGVIELTKNCGDYDEIVGLQEVQPNVEAAMEVNPQEFINLFQNRVIGM